MWTIDAIRALARDHGLEVTTHWPSSSTTSPEAPKPSSLTLWFKEPAPVAWQALMSEPTEIPVAVYGTRQSTGSGATDGMLHPGYAALLDVVNARRVEAGLERVRN